VQRPPITSMSGKAAQAAQRGTLAVSGGRLLSQAAIAKTNGGVGDGCGQAFA